MPADTDRGGMTGAKVLRDPVVPALAVSALLVGSGFATIALAWRGAARTLSVGQQVPEVLSGALGGLALVVAGCAVAFTALRRRAAADAEVAVEQLRSKIISVVDSERFRQRLADRRSRR